MTKALYVGKSYHRSSEKWAHSFVSLLDESVYERIVVWLEGVVFRPTHLYAKNGLMLFGASDDDSTREDRSSVPENPLVIILSMT